MARPPRAREKVLDAFQELLVTEGERAASMDAVARAAGVSKGGLLYHFPSKLALEEGIAERLATVAADDAQELVAAPDGPVAAFIRTSTDASNIALERAIAATTVLATSGSEPAGAALIELRRLWRDLLRPYVRDETSLMLVLLVGDGVYFNSALANGLNFATVPQLEHLDELIQLVTTVVAPDPDATTDPA